MEKGRELLLPVGLGNVQKPDDPLHNLSELIVHSGLLSVIATGDCGGALADPGHLPVERLLPSGEFFDPLFEAHSILLVGRPRARGPLRELLLLGVFFEPLEALLVDFGNVEKPGDALHNLGLPFVHLDLPFIAPRHRCRQLFDLGRYVPVFGHQQFHGLGERLMPFGKFFDPLFESHPFLIISRL